MAWRLPGQRLVGVANKAAGMGGTESGSATLRSWPALALALGGVFSAACAAPSEGAARVVRPEPLYVASLRDAQVAPLDGASGRALGQPLPVGQAPRQVVVDPSGAVLVAGDAGLELLDGATWGPGTRWEQRGTHWPAATVALEEGARVRLLAGDGAGNVAVAYTVRPQHAEYLEHDRARRCRLALVDLGAGEVTRTLTLCAEGEAVTGLAAERTPAGTIVYAALWRMAQGPQRGEGAAGGVAGGVAGGGRASGARLVALDVSTGALLGAAALGGQPRPADAGSSLLLAPGPGGTTRRLYVVEALPGPLWATWNEEEYGWTYRLAVSWRLVRYALDGLGAEAAVPLGFAPVGLAVSPDGASGYAFDAGSDWLVEMDLNSGGTKALAHVPGGREVPGGLAVGSERVYAAAPRSDEVWVFERRSGRRVHVLGVGQFPASIVAFPARQPEASS